MKRALSLAGVGGLVLAGSVLGLAGPAQAHDYLVDQSPVAGSTATALDTVSVTANARLEDLTGTGSGFGILVQDAAGLYYNDGCVTIDGATMTTDAALGAAGTYTVTWQLVSSDGHPVSDTFDFEWAPGENVEATAGSAAVPDCGGPAEAAPVEEEPAASGSISTIVWIVIAVAATGLAVGLTLLLTRRR